MTLTSLVAVQSHMHPGPDLPGQVNLITTANRLNTYLSNTVITPEDSSETAASVSA